MTKLYLFSKSIHRYLVLIVSTLTILMAGTGIMLKYLFLPMALGFDPGTVRYIHNQLSVLFTIALVLMMLTGIIMYIFPLLKKKTIQPEIPPPQNQG
jgi:hypothetical protein